MIKKSDFKKLRYAVIILTIILLALVVLFIVLYFSKSHGHLSFQLKDWTDFGSFFGGTIWVILTFLNFLIIGYLTVKIHLNHDQQWLTELRSPFYKDAIEKAYSTTDQKLKDKESLDSYISWLDHTDFKNLLFLVNPKEERHLSTLKDKFTKTLYQLKSNLQFEIAENTQLISDFNEAKMKFTNFLGAIMMDKTNDYLNQRT
jgi:hypothetical protein